MGRDIESQRDLELILSIEHAFNTKHNPKLHPSNESPKKVPHIKDTTPTIIHKKPTIKNLFKRLQNDL